MKPIISKVKVLIFIGAFSLLATSCEDFMSTKTNRYMSSDENQLDTANDTVYSIVGILQKVQKVADKYVLTGELRGDLLDVSTEADLSLRALSTFTVDPATSQFCDVKDYYAIINNCNYLIQNANVNLTSKGVKTFSREVAAAKAIRAWTYMQLVLNYGKASYTEEPILTIDQSLKNYPEFDQLQMVDTLISQISALNPNLNYTFPGFTKGSKSMFINPLYLLGDLYLWRASFTHNTTDYEYAALYYAYLIRKETSVINSGTAAYWGSELFKFQVDSWSNMFYSKPSSEIITAIQMSQTVAAGTASDLPLLAYQTKIIPAKNYLNFCDLQPYCYKDPASTETNIITKFKNGDLRGQAGLDKKVVIEDFVPQEISYITKYRGSYVILYRVGQLYLRYAEAVNRAGKPQLAFAVLKYGLKATTLANTKYIPAAEISDNKEYVNIFRSEFANTNIGLHNRGAGSIGSEGGSTFNSYFAIPDGTVLPTRNDTINFVENTICNELALETAYEGNRFQDLMRISNHRNDPSFLATKVAEKHANDKDRIITLLSDKKNWYLPMRNY